MQDLELPVSSSKNTALVSAGSVLHTNASNFGIVSKSISIAFSNTYCVRIFYACVIVSIVSLIITACRWGWADIQAIGERNVMQGWESARMVSDEQSWQRAVQRLYLAAELDEENAVHFADLGRAHEWRALQYPIWTRQSKEFRTKAIQHYLQAVELRPTWGYLWAHYAYSKVLNKEFDANTVIALDKAMTLAPWESEVQLKIIWIGLNLWDFLSEEMHGRLAQTISRSLAMQSLPTLRLLKRTGRTDIVRLLLDADQLSVFKDLTP